MSCTMTGSTFHSYWVDYPQLLDDDEQSKMSGSSLQSAKHHKKESKPRRPFYRSRFQRGTTPMAVTETAAAIADLDDLEESEADMLPF